MKFAIWFKTVMVVLSLIFILLISGCTTFEIPEEVCTYGQMTCETGTFICENYELPPAVCTYFSIACTNLNLLCSSEYGSDQYKSALKNLNEANLAINKFVTDQKVAAPVK